ncbi:IKI3-domain-containing protein [Wallemia mellicola]|nr:IKI3-domain-containing protein [Wallemia mellicola]
MRSLIEFSNKSIKGSKIPKHSSLRQVSYSPDLELNIGVFEQKNVNKVDFLVVAFNTQGLSKEVTNVSLQAAEGDQSQLISVNYLPDDSSICILARSGDIALIRLQDFSFDQTEDYPTEIVGTVEPGIVAASWSPDEELLVIVTLNDDLLLMSANGNFDVLAEMPLRSTDFGQDKNVNVGWGSKSTQFHGRAGKQAASLPGGPSLVTEQQKSEPVGLADDDGKARVTWRSDSAFFAVSTLDLLDKETGDGQVKARVIRVYSRASAALQSTSEFAPGLTQSLAWRKGAGAPSIAAVQRFGQTPGCAAGYDHLDVVFFERNGLRHGEFTLKGVAQEQLVAGKIVSVRELEWSADGSVVAAWLDIDGKDVIQLYSTGNWHWYLKAEIHATELYKSRVESIKFSDETALSLNVVMSSEYRTIEWAWTVYSSPNEVHDLGLVAVVDGEETKFTPLGVANVPPPMSLYQVKSQGTPIQLTFNHSKFAVLLPLGKLEVYSYDGTKPHSKPTLEKSTSLPSRTRQIAWMDEQTLAITYENPESNSPAIGVFEIINEELSQVKFDSDVQLDHSFTVKGPDGSALIQDAQSRLFKLTQEGILDELDIVLDGFCPHLQYHEATSNIVAMSANGKLKIGNIDAVMMSTLANNALSFSLTPEFLIATTSSHKAIFLDLNEQNDNAKLVEELEERRVERGSRIVVSCPRAMRLVLQMPRGNLETIAPRPLVLQNVKRDVDRGDYRNAFIACRKHRIDMNIIFDHNPQAFFDRLSTFIDQIPEVDHLNLFLTGLRTEDLTLTQYAKKKIENIDASRPDKANEICTAIRTELEKRDLVAYTQTIMTSYVRMTPPDVEASLNLLHKLKSVDSEIAEEGVKYIIFLVDSRTLFDVALGMYDFELVLMVAQHSQRDPKEYLPFLRELQGMETDVQRFHIDDHLRRYKKALANIYKADGHLETFITYTQDHDLYTYALELSKGDSDNHKVVLEVYGDSLMEKKLYKDAALAYILAKLSEKAMEAYDRAHAWQELFGLMSVHGIEKSEIEDTAYRVAEDLNQRRRFQEAGRVLFDYTDDVQAAADQFVKGSEFAEAIRICIYKNRSDLVESFIKPSLVNTQETMMDEADEMEEQLAKQLARLDELRKAKLAAPEAFYLEESLENNPALDNVDVSSEATTAFTQFTRYTQRASTFASSAMTGKNKLIINHLDRLFVTNDAATIVQELEVVHPAAKLVVMASRQQEQEVGDGSNLVLILAGELLKKAENLLVMGLHPSEIVQGYELARNKALDSLAELENDKLELPVSKDSLVKSIKTSLGSKQFGNEDFLSDLVADAAITVMPKDPSQFNIDNVRVVKIMGGNLYESRVLRGMVFGRQPEGVARNAQKAKVAVFTCGIDISQTETKGTVLLKNADEMLNFTRGEEQQIEKILKEIADSGVKVVVAGSQVGDLALHYLNRLDIVVIKVLSKFELRRLCRVVGATPLARLGAPTPEEAGHIDVLETTEIGGDRVTVFRQDNDQLTRTATIVLRGATANHLDDIERAIDDGAGASEIELAKIIENFGDKTPGLNQHAIKKFAQALEIIPITLSDNAGLNSTEVLSKLWAAHSTEEGKNMGIDVDAISDEGLIDTKSLGIKDSLAAKWWAIKYAVESAIAVLRVDSIIMSKAAGLAPPQQQGHWDDD